MARLRNRVTIKVSPPPESSGNESAEEQLLAESQLSASKSPQPPINIAVRSASLLNAVRTEKRHGLSYPTPSSPSPHVSRPAHVARSSADMVRRKGKAGQLKRPGSLNVRLTTNPQTNLARRGDDFGFPSESPGKASHVSPFKLPGTVNRHKPLKRTKKAKSAQPQTTTVAVDSFSGMSLPGAPVSVRGKALSESAQPTTGGHYLRNSEASRQKSGRLADDRPDLSHSDLANTQGFHHHHNDSHSKRKAADEPHATQRHSKSPRIEAPKDKGSPNAPGKLRRSREPCVMIPSSSAPKQGSDHTETRTDLLDIENDALLQTNLERAVTDEVTSAGLGRLSVESQPPRTRKGKSAKVAKINVPHKASSEPAVGAGASHVSRSVVIASGRQTRARARKAETALSSRRTRRRRAEVGEEADGLFFQDKTGDAAPANNVPEERKHGKGDIQDVATENGGVRGQGAVREEEEQPDLRKGDVFAHDGTDEETADIDRVFRFLDLEGRSGHCQTTDARLIERACRSAAKLLQQPNVTYADVSDTSKELRSMLVNVCHDQDDEVRRSFKVDAYGYLFRALTEYLELLYSWLEENYGDPSRSLEAMRILTPFVHSMTVFKDMIASWRVVLPQRYQNDRLVQDVDRQLIGTLRKVEAFYRATLSQLEAAYKANRVQQELKQKRRERQLEREREEGARVQRQQRWQAWQDLHVWRLLCEPDLLLRRRLFIDPDLFATRFEDIEERDANGVKFERVPLFKERVSPPAHRGSPAAEEEWSDSQMMALIDGLRTYAGPNVFRKIFEKHCRPGGALQQFTVPEITAQASSIRSTLIHQYQSNKWEVPAWLQQIPVLP